MGFPRDEVKALRKSADEAKDAYVAALEEHKRDARENRDEYAEIVKRRLNVQGNSRFMGFNLRMQEGESGVQLWLSHDQKGELRLSASRDTRDYGSTEGRDTVKRYIHAIEELERVVKDLNVVVIARHLAWEWRLNGTD